MVERTVIHWFQNDLRLADNGALDHAVRLGRVLPLYILDDGHGGREKMGSASRVWLHHSLNSLNDSLDQSLAVFSGDPFEVLLFLIEHYSITDVCWNIRYEPWYQKRDKKIIKWLECKGINVHVFNGALLWKPEALCKEDGAPYKVFGAFYKKIYANNLMPETPLPSVKSVGKWIVCAQNKGVQALGLLPRIRWDEKVMSGWEVGESVAEQLLESFLKNEIQGYKVQRDFPAQSRTSKLSMHIHFGEISVRQIFYSVQKLSLDIDAEGFIRQLCWREFSYNLLYHNPNLSFENLQSKFDSFPWSTNKRQLKAWQSGQTGIPLVDAGMRELWKTGYMHNRLRMITGSFLVKNLQIDWRKGERWFWDCLIDADLANNSAGWQWIAGCGTDASPYFRIFNPVTQGKKFDPEGIYVKKFVPELKDMPLSYLFNPWEAPKHVLDQAGVEIGKTYPKPIVDLKSSRLKALEIFSSLK